MNVLLSFPLILRITNRLHTLTHINRYSLLSPLSCSIHPQRTPRCPNVFSKHDGDSSRPPPPPPSPSPSPSHPPFQTKTYMSDEEELITTAAAAAALDLSPNGRSFPPGPLAKREGPSSWPAGPPSPPPPPPPRRGSFVVPPPSLLRGCGRRPPAPPTSSSLG